MKIHSPNKNSLIILLNPSDMEKLNLRTETMVYSDKHTRQVLWTLFTESRIALGQETKHGLKTMIEIMPFDNGGCLICFTLKSENTNIRIIPKLKKTSAVYEFEEKDGFRQMSNSAEAQHIDISGELYENDNTYRFILNHAVSENKNLLSEFASKINHPLVESTTREYWNKIN